VWLLDFSGEAEEEDGEWPSGALDRDALLLQSLPLCLPPGAQCKGFRGSLIKALQRAMASVIKYSGMPSGMHEQVNIKHCHGPVPPAALLPWPGREVGGQLIQLVEAGEWRKRFMIWSH